MKEQLIDDLKKFKEQLKQIDATYTTIRQEGLVHTKHLDTLRSIEAILCNVINKVDRFYTEKYRYNKVLNDLSRCLQPFRAFYGEVYPGGFSMEDCRQRIIDAIDGMINELRAYGLPSDKDPKLNR